METTCINPQWIGHGKLMEYSTIFPWIPQRLGHGKLMEYSMANLWIPPMDWPWKTHRIFHESSVANPLGESMDSPKGLAIKKLMEYSTSFPWIPQWLGHGKLMDYSMANLWIPPMDWPWKTR